MKIIKETSNLMVLKDKSIIAFIVGGLFFLFGIASIVFPKILTNEIPWWFKFLFTLIGLIVIFTNKTTMVSFNKEINKLSLEYKRLIGRKTEEYELGQIKQVELQETRKNSGERTRYYYNIVLVFNNNETIILPAGPTVSAIGMRFNRGRKVSEKIAQFLDVPFKERRSPTLSEALSAVKDVVREEMQKRSKQ